MNKNNNKMDLLGNAPVPQALMALGIPIMIGMLINALYNLVDAYFIGGLGESQMGAISIAFPLGQVVVGLGLMFGNGAASYLSRLLGRGDREAASKVASTALYSSVCIGCSYYYGTAIFLKPILTMLGATDTIMPYALSYGRIYVISCIFNVFNVTMNNIVASEGSRKNNYVCIIIRSCIEYWFRSYFHLYSRHGGCWCGNRYSNFSNGFYSCIFNLCITEKKRFYIFH